MRAWHGSLHSASFSVTCGSQGAVPPAISSASYPAAPVTTDAYTGLGQDADGSRRNAGRHCDDYPQLRQIQESAGRHVAAVDGRISDDHDRRQSRADETPVARSTPATRLHAYRTDCGTIRRSRWLYRLERALSRSAALGPVVSRCRQSSEAAVASSASMAWTSRVFRTSAWSHLGIARRRKGSGGLSAPS